MTFAFCLRVVQTACSGLKARMKTMKPPDGTISWISGLGDGDVLICVSASGSTPYTLATMRAAKKANAVTIAIANNPDTPLLNECDHPILLKTPPEIIAGSTRLGAASAQKVVLNMISTLVALRLGHAVRGHMVNLVADNEKLRLRAQRILQDLTDCSPETAENALREANGRVKIAVLMLKKRFQCQRCRKCTCLKQRRPQSVPVV